MTGAALLIGAGGLGCGAALALAAGGAKHLIVVDDDTVDESNLHRQILHGPVAVGQPKVESLTNRLRQQFPLLQVTPVRGRLDTGTARALFERCQVALDGSDNLGTKFLANDAAVLTGKPLIHSAAVGTGGQLLTIPAGGRPCYRCLFEELPPPDDQAPSCAEAGVLGPVPGVLGALAAVEALRLLRGDNAAYVGRLVRYDSLFMTMRAVRFRANPTCGVCGAAPTISALHPARYGEGDCLTAGCPPL